MWFLSPRLVVLAVLLPLLGVAPWMALAEEEEPQSGLLPPAFIEPLKGFGEGPLFPAEKVDPIQPIQLEWDCFQLANDARANPAAYGYPSYSPAPPLHWNAALLTVAWTHSKDMYTDDYFEHETYDRIGGELVLVCDMAARVRSYYTFNVRIAENIAWNTSGSAQGVIQQWMDSPPHREALMNPEFTEGAIGAFGGSDKVYFTHNFGARTISHNLAIGGADITLDPASPNPGDTVRVRFTVHNTGATDAYPVEVRFYSRPQGGVLVCIDRGAVDEVHPRRRLGPDRLLRYRHHRHVLRHRPRHRN